jgi:ADP-heptose:LPS heptosyltransferase
LAEKIERRIRLAFASFLFRLVRAKPASGNPFELAGPAPRILVVRQQNQMGDMLLTTPCFRALRETLPESLVTLVASDENQAVVRNNPDLSEVLLYSKKLFRRRPWRLFSFIATLRRRQFDVGIVLSTVSLSVTSVLLCLLSGAKYRVGYSGRSFGMGFVDGTFHVVVPLVDGTIHQTRLGLRLLEHFGIHTQDLSPVMLPGQDAEKFAEEFVVSQGLQHGAVPLHGAKPPGSTGPVVGIHPGAGKKKNRWPVSGFAYVASALSREFDARILLVGGPADREVLDSLLEILEFRPVLLTGETLDRVAAVMKRLSLFICNDTGVLHVAASVGCPTLSLFGPTDPRRWAPLSERVRTLRAPSLDIATLKEAEVLAAAVEKLSGKGAKGAR